MNQREIANQKIERKDKDPSSHSRGHCHMATGFFVVYGMCCIDTWRHMAAFQMWKITQVSEILSLSSGHSDHDKQNH